MQQVLRHIIRVAATKPDACAPDAGSWIPGATAASAQKSVSGITCTSITHVQLGICQTSHFIGCHQTQKNEAELKRKLNAEELVKVLEKDVEDNNQNCVGKSRHSGKMHSKIGRPASESVLDSAVHRPHHRR